MKRLTIFAIAVLLALAPIKTYAATEGSCTFTKNNLTAGAGTVNRVLRTWVCTASGSTGNVGSANPAAIIGSGYGDQVLSGAIHWAEIIPGTSGDQPTAITTCKLVPSDDSGVDYLGGLGAGASNSATTARMPVDATNKLPIEIGGRQLTVIATGLGNSKKVTIRILSDR